MKRREFIKNLGMATGAGVATLSISGMPIKAFAKPFLNIQSTNGKILVLIQLKGGNDGLNMVIPLDQYSTYISKRPTIGIAESSIIKLNNQTGIHPSLTGLKPLYDSGKFTIIQNVGYASPNRSHFRSTDIWLSASDSNQVLYDGWIGRYLLKTFPDFPNLPPRHPMAIQIGSVQSGLFDSSQGGLAVSFDNPDSFFSLVNGITADTDIPPATLAGEELKFLKEVASLSIQYATVIKQAADAQTNKATYPSTTFASQLKIIADLIAGGLETPVYLATLDGFDTHSGELAAHQRLFGYLGDAIAAFQTDLELLGVADKVVLLTFSEFGRRVAENASGGTDHGTAAPMFIVGKNVQGNSVFNANASLTNLDSNGDLKYVIDFRQVYATMLIDHFGMTSTQAKDILLKDFLKLALLKSTTGVEYTPGLPDSYILEQNYPNPFNPSTKIRYTIPSPQQVSLKVYDSLGRLVQTLVDSYQSAGSYTINFNGSNLASGTYLYSLETENQKIVKKMILIK